MQDTTSAGPAKQYYEKNPVTTLDFREKLHNRIASCQVQCTLFLPIYDCVNT